MEKKNYKLTNRDGNYARRLNSKRSNFCITLPDFVEENGVFKPSAFVEVRTLAEFNEYKNKYEGIVEFLQAHYPTVVSTIYRNVLTELADAKHQTILGKMLAGKAVKSSEAYQAAFSPNVEYSCWFGLNNFNYVKAGFEGKKVELLPRKERTKKNVMDMFKEDKEMYIIPEIDENGLVVSTMKGKKDRFDVKFIAVPAEDFTNEQVIDYLTAPFGDRSLESGIDFQEVAENCKKSSSQLDDGRLAKEMQALVDYFISFYPLSFANIKADSNKSKVEAREFDEIEPPQPQEETGEEDIIEEETVEEEIIAEEVVEEDMSKFGSTMRYHIVEVPVRASAITGVGGKPVRSSSLTTTRMVIMDR